MTVVVEEGHWGVLCGCLRLCMVESGCLNAMVECGRDAGAGQ